MVQLTYIVPNIRKYCIYPLVFVCVCVCVRVCESVWLLFGCVLVWVCACVGVAHSIETSHSHLQGRSVQFQVK
jgi:hypothetical protein